MENEKARALAETGKAAIVHEVDRAIAEAFGADTFKDALWAISLQARLLVGAHQSATSYIPKGNFKNAIHTHSFSSKYEKWNSYDVMPTGEGIWGCVVERRQPMRMTEQELLAHSRFKNFSHLKDARGLEHPPMPGWLAVPVLSKDDEFLGVVQLSDKHGGDFTEEDQELLTHLAKLISPTFALQQVNEQLDAALIERKQAEQEVRKLNEELERRVQERTQRLRERTAELRRSDERFRLVLKAPIVLFTQDRDLRFTWVYNPTPGFEADGLIGKTDAEVAPPDQAAAPIALKRQVLETGKAARREIAVSMAGKTSWQDLHVEPHRDASGEVIGVTCITIDITDRKRMEEELRAVNSELEAFAYSVSHDLRAPLRTMDGFSMALLEDYGKKLDERGADYLARVRAGAQRMGRLIDDLLGLFAVTEHELRRETVDLAKIAQRILARLREANPKRDVELRIPKRLPATGDPRLLETTLDNLLDNAWKFTGNQPAASIELGVTQRAGQTAYYIRDNGVGFDMAYVGKLFQPFQRLHGPNEFPGTGIGLATVRRIVSRHGGKTWADGEVGTGATFYFTLDRD